jgi:hypothetical protein
MTATRAASITLIALSPILAPVPYSAAQAPNARAHKPALPDARARDAVDQNGLTCVIYGLNDVADDPNLGAWIAETLPGVIQPESWRQAGGLGVVSYYGPAQLMVVYQTPAAHAEVEKFLANAKRARSKPLPVRATANSIGIESGTAPVQFTAPALTHTAEAPTGTKSAYPIPPPLQHPKHLFHFMIRYEGDGSTVDTGVSLAKALVGDAGPVAEKTDDAESKPSKTPSAGQLFHLILRYEGEGIIDANVVEVIKAFQKETDSSPAPLIAPPPPESGNGSQPGTTSPQPVPLSQPTLPCTTAPVRSPNAISGNVQPGAALTPSVLPPPGVPATTIGATLPGVPSARTPNGPYMPPADEAPIRTPSAR